MVKLQKPEFAFMNGKLIQWDDAVLHVGCEAVNRGLNVFEGIKGYWQKDGRFGIVELKQHYNRLLRSAKLLHIPWLLPYEEYKNSIFQIIGALANRNKDMWCRTTLFVVEGHWGDNTKADLVITAFHQDMELPKPIDLGVSTWQRSSDASLPARIKTSTNYQVGRLARIEGRSKNYDDMILLNQWGRVAEATTSCILIVRDGVIYTPPATEGALESITINIAEKLANSLRIPFMRQPIDRTEILISDEIAICGTLAEFVPVKSIEGNKLNPNGPIFSLLRKNFFETVRGENQSRDIEFEFIPEGVFINKI